MSRIDEVKEHWKEITEKLSGNQENFKDYLSFAGKTFKYSFADSALIYAQQPNATMIADLPTWNKVGRRINRGAKSIAVFGEENKCRFIFDVSDTNGQKAPMQWRLDENLSNDILTEVNETYGLECTNLNTYLLTDAAGVLMPFSSRTYFSESGISYGLNRITNAMIVLDRTDEMNSNGFTLGASGSGKSMQSKSEVWDVRMKYPDDEIIVVDPENEYMPLVKPFDGEIIKLAPESRTKMNIFDTDLAYSEEGVSAISMKSEFIMTIVETAKGLPLTSAEKSLVDRCIKIVYHDFIDSNGDKDKLPTLTTFYEILLKQPEPEAKDIAVALELYVKGSFNSFADKTNIEINKKFLVIDIFEMGEQLRTVGLQVILEFLWQRVIENKKRGVRTWVWIDEFSIMFNDGSGRETHQSGEFFAKVYKRIRKHGGVVTGITQNITEVLQSKQAQTMLSNSEFVILLQQKKNDLDKLVEIFELSYSQEQFLKTGEKGSGLIICGKKVIPFIKLIPKESLMYEICSTNFREQQAKLKSSDKKQFASVSR